MRFVVMIDLVSTIIQPITVGYIVYLVYLVVGQHKQIPTVSLVLIAAVYGLQALVFVLRRKWDMIGWMVFYILAIPAFSFFLPLYSFWRMDDFSWGATRVVMGEKGKRMIVHDEGKFDPRSIPLKSWNDYENELWDKESNHSGGSWAPPKLQHDGYAESRTASIYGNETYYEPAMSRAYSPAPSHMGSMMYQPPAYQAGPHSGRNTPMGYNVTGNSHHSNYHPQQQTRASNYLGADIPGTKTPEDADIWDGPSDAELERAVQDLLRDADLNTITKREIRRRLQERFDMDLTSRKATINAAIDRVLLSHA